MDDAKRAYREAENKTKEALRRADGEESLPDKAANLGDDVRQGSATPATRSTRRSTRPSSVRSTERPV